MALLQREGSDYTVPIGPAVSKVQKLGRIPVRLQLGVQWLAVQPDRDGQEWNVQRQIAPVLPKLIRGELLGAAPLEFGLPLSEAASRASAVPGPGAAASAPAAVPRPRVARRARLCWAPVEIEELEARLPPFVRAKTGDPAARVSGVHRMPGHAGFAYGFDAEWRAGREAFFLRLPPPNVKWQGTADVLRQVQALRALDGSDVPHCPVRWAGEDLEWFGRPYFVVPKLAGDVLRLGPGEWGAELSAARLRDMARQAMRALAGIHRVDWQERAPGLGPPLPFTDDVERWDRFVPKLAEPARFRLQPRVRERLLARLPSDARVGLFHGDFQVANLFYALDGRLLAVIDWELVGIGATGNDVGWIATFNDPEAWAALGRGPGPGETAFPRADELVALYVEAWGAPLADLAWYRALAAYKFAIISGLNLALHRRGKRPDPLWEEIARSVEPLLERAAALLG